MYELNPFLYQTLALGYFFGLSLLSISICKGQYSDSKQFASIIYVQYMINMHSLDKGDEK